MFGIENNNGSVHGGEISCRLVVATNHAVKALQMLSAWLAAPTMLGAVPVRPDRVFAQVPAEMTSVIRPLNYEHVPEQTPPDRDIPGRNKRTGSSHFGP